MFAYVPYSTDDFIWTNLDFQKIMYYCFKFSAIPMEEMGQQDNVILVATHYGGHYGFLEGLIPRGPGYVDKVFRQYLDAVFKHGDDELKGK